MCLIVVAFGVSPRYPLIVAANRDEQHARPSAEAAWWPEPKRVLGGRDLSAGGTWLAVDARGRFAAVTNIRDAQRPLGLESRGSLVVDFLAGGELAASYAARAARNGARFGAFNLLLYDGRELHFASNRAATIRLGAGWHAYSNAPPGIAWPKTATALAAAPAALASADPTDAMFALLAQRDLSEPAELRYQRTHFVVGAVYGTRCSTVVLFDPKGQASFAERTFDARGTAVAEVRESFEIEP
jgi:uncharacterized protein with NRDE domain